MVWFLSPHVTLILTRAVVSRLRYLVDAAGLDEGLDLGDQLFGGLELVDDLLRRVPGPSHGEFSG